MTNKCAWFLGKLEALMRFYTLMINGCKGYRLIEGPGVSDEMQHLAL